MSTSPMGANKPIEDIEATLLAATKSALLVRLPFLRADRERALLCVAYETLARRGELVAL
jgi:hypothetical protein